MEIEKLADWVKERNQKGKNTGILVLAIYFCLQFIVCTMFGADRILLLIGGLCVVFVAVLDVWRYQCDIYLKINEGEGFPNDSKNISEVLRFHAFSVDDYFAVIQKKLMGKVVVLSIVSIGIGILTGFSVEKDFDAVRCFLVTVFGIIGGLSMFLMLRVKKKIFIHQCQIGERGKLHVGLSILSALFSLVEAVAIVSIWPTFSLLFEVIMLGVFSPSIDETMVVYRCYPNGGGYVGTIIFGFLGIFAIATRHQLKKLGKVIIFMSVFGLIASVFGVAIENRNYIEIKGNEITVSSLPSQVTYSLDDVRKFKIGEKDGSIQMVLYIGSNCGNTLELTGTVTQTSELYEQKYYSDYNYFADLAQILMEKGAKGRVGDISKLKESVEGYDLELKQGLDQILETVPVE